MNKRYSQSFKSAVMKQVIVDGKSIRSAAIANGINQVTLSKWLKQYHEQSTQEDYTDDYKLLKSRLEEVISERDTLRATIAILLKEYPINA